jgi:small GTP-binding protein
MKHVTIGIVAHVDAGKTTLSEAFLYESGTIKNLGRVDRRDTLFDNDEQERDRGITIFSKQGEFGYGDTRFTLIDTPGHSDFTAEMERSLQILDYAVLVISGSDGVQAHTRTLWRLLKQYEIPTFIFVNKMDRPDNDAKQLLAELKAELSDGVVDIYDYAHGDGAYEEIAMASGDEDILEQYMETGMVETKTISGLILTRKLYPCIFGSALKLDGVEPLLSCMDRYVMDYCDIQTYQEGQKLHDIRYESDEQTDRDKHSDYDTQPAHEEFGARVYKITRDEKGVRLTHIKIMSGSLRVKDVLCRDADGNDEKVNQIRIYNGNDYETTDELGRGYVCAVTGPASTCAGQGLGSFGANNMELIEPVISYRMSFDEKVSARKLYPQLKQLEEELPELLLEWNESDESIGIRLMGQVQTEILTQIIKQRFGVVADFDQGRITYRETIAAPVIGVGHFEPLRHYAEAHIRIEPGERGSGIEIAADCSEDVLDRNWQRLIMTHLRERHFTGVAVGGQLTDVKLTVINGRAHTKHTEGGDFRQATYRAVRQGLMQADTVILEPYYNFLLDIPDTMVGRAMTDMENMHAHMEAPELANGRAVIRGYGPVATMRNYQINVNAYTSGTGSIAVAFRGYDVCHNPDEVLAESGYDPDMDLRNPSSSVFCAHGSGFIVPWDQVKSYMHVFDDEERQYDTDEPEIRSRESFDYSIGTDEIDEIFARTFAANKNKSKSAYKKQHRDMHGINAPGQHSAAPASVRTREKLLVVDGYNVIFAWQDLKEIAGDNINAAKDKLISLLSNYRGITGIGILLVFDGYKVKENKGSETVAEGIRVVHTKEGETADSYIERYTHEHVKTHDITVATSDGLIQTVVRGNGCLVISSRELHERLETAAAQLRDEYNL